VRKVDLGGTSMQRKYRANYAIRQPIYIIHWKGDIPLNRKQQIKQLYQVQQLELYQSNPVQNLVLPSAELALD
jgi:hypothetical protein